MHWHWSEILTGVGFMGLLGHAVSTFPTPTNAYGKWFLGCIQFFVGQRLAGANTIKGQDSTIVATPVSERGQNMEAKIKPPEVIAVEEAPTQEIKPKP